MPAAPPPRLGPGGGATAVPVAGPLNGRSGGSVRGALRPGVRPLGTVPRMTGNGKARESGTVQSLDRAITILEVLARSGLATSAEIAGELGVHRSTAFRLITTMEARGLVEQADDRSGYRIGVGLVRLAGSTTARLDVVREARPFSKALASDTGQTVNIAILVEDSALYLDQVTGDAALQPHNWTGRRIPLHATSNGKVLLSALERGQVNAILPDLERFTPRTITRRTTLHRVLAEVRERGYAVAVDELEEGMSAVGAPLCDAHGEVVAALSVSGSTYRLSGDVLDEAIVLVRRAAREISLRLGWDGSDLE